MCTASFQPVMSSRLFSALSYADSQIVAYDVLFFFKDSTFLLAISLRIGSKRGHRYFYLHVSHDIYIYTHVCMYI